MDNPILALFGICGGFIVQVIGLLIWEKIQLERKVEREWEKIPTYQKKRFGRKFAGSL